MIQKAVLHVPLADVCRLFDRLRHKVRTFIHDVDGYHVISAYIKRMSAGAENAAEDDDPAVPAPSPLQSILDTLLSTLERTATNRCGCRVVQQVLERCPGTPRAAVLDAVTGGGRDRLARLIADPYGNYVVQAAWDVGGAATRDTVLDVLTADGALAALARHKYASAIVEAVLERGPGRHRARLLEKMLEVSQLVFVCWERLTRGFADGLPGRCSSARPFVATGHERGVRGLLLPARTGAGSHRQLRGEQGH